MSDPELAEVLAMQQDTREEIARLRKAIDDTQRTLEIVEAAAVDLRADLVTYAATWTPPSAR